ncbi:hypothetical protein [Acidovorax sp. sic0104]|uniref:hypothetical protein n=1 Tax=Acidovorax sp. sic0104 TaxID=2854784 RepID=UPI001C446AF9|nr:hypothetical protein [Acidovorax sp. sic0104]MBV7543414.1 hypothetical protein [Acidovorax sp. sic0104]
MIILIGAPGTGAQALCAALEARFAASEQRPRLDWSHTLDNLAFTGTPAADEIPTTWLLMGLDVPCSAIDRPVQEAHDAALRAALARAGASYRVVYGQGEQRVANALSAIKNIAISTHPPSVSSDFHANSEDHTGRAAPSARLRAWNCEKCSDPECEHRLFTALTGRAH